MKTTIKFHIFYKKGGCSPANVSLLLRGLPTNSKTKYFQSCSLECYLNETLSECMTRKPLSKHILEGKDPINVKVTETIGDLLDGQANPTVVIVYSSGTGVRNVDKIELKEKVDEELVEDLNVNIMDRPKTNPSEEPKQEFPTERIGIKTENTTNFIEQTNFGQIFSQKIETPPQKKSKQTHNKSKKSSRYDHSIHPPFYRIKVDGMDNVTPIEIQTHGIKELKIEIQKKFIDIEWIAFGNYKIKFKDMELELDSVLNEVTIEDTLIVIEDKKKKQENAIKQLKEKQSNKETSEEDKEQLGECIKLISMGIEFCSLTKEEEELWNNL